MAVCNIQHSLIDQPTDYTARQAVSPADTCNYCTTLSLHWKYDPAWSSQHLSWADEDDRETEAQSYMITEHAAIQI